MFKLHFLNTNKQLPSDSVIEVIKKIREGDLPLRENFIFENKPYIIRSLCKILKRYISEEYNEEFSIGLSAFNEAIEHYDIERRGNFYKYSYLLMYHRIIDYNRKNKRNVKAIPFSSIDNNELFEEKYLSSDAHHQYEKIEIKEEILVFQQKLQEFGITWDTLISNSPKHMDTRCLCIKIARIIAENKNLYDKLLRTKNIPQMDVMSHIKVHRRTIENHRIFIIALCIILSSNQDGLKEFILHFEERRKGS